MFTCTPVLCSTGNFMVRQIFQPLQGLFSTLLSCHKHNVSFIPEHTLIIFSRSQWMLAYNASCHVRKRYFFPWERVARKVTTPFCGHMSHVSAWTTQLRLTSCVVPKLSFQTSHSAFRVYLTARSFLSWYLSDISLYMWGSDNACTVGGRGPPAGRPPITLVTSAS